MVSWAQAPGRRRDAERELVVWLGTRKRGAVEKMAEVQKKSQFRTAMEDLRC